ncbi:N-acetylglucosaminyl-phosphatidylinositol de-N-acetylase-like [Orbicella faveolata]|uniref:N-acetylglucosaminyl-phosphatidylinositol de-N-acetylase-like n=1 Tax=Orbicella faveolata TaxID=48498 RepID=UPI0009E1CF1C|nr:N-acetylglucosaminyl-phosphatidylinositol de-N-acetylase-like [Orbicella faveolata]
MFPRDLCWILFFPLFVVILSSLLILFYYRQLRLQKVKKYEFNNKTVLVITAHPDDECMFFSPSILNLPRFCTAHVLCLSTGNYYQQGNIRKQELFSSCRILGIPSSHVTVKDHHSLPDDPNVDWDTKIASQIIADHIKHNQFQVVITFDSYGVSGHSNHIAIYKAVKRLKDNGLLEDVTVYVLSSISILRKYISLLDLPFSVYSQQMFLSSPQDIILAQKAMYAHRSQLLWFRRLYILFSRFMMINTLQELK